MRVIGLSAVVLLGCVAGCESAQPPASADPPPKTEVKKGANGEVTTVTSVPVE